VEAQWSNSRALGCGAEGWWFESQSGPLTGKLSLFTQQLNGYLDLLQGGKAAKGEEMGTAFRMPCPLKQWFSTCHCPYGLSRLWDPLPYLYLTWAMDMKMSAAAPISAYYYYDNRYMAPLTVSRTTQVIDGTRKVKPIWIYWSKR